MSHTLQGTINIGNNIKWGTVEINNNRIPGTDNESPTMVEGTLDLIYARGEGTTHSPGQSLHYLPCMQLYTNHAGIVFNGDN